MKHEFGGGETPPERPKDAPAATHLDDLVAMRDGLAISIEERQAQLAVFDVSIEHELELLKFKEGKDGSQAIQ